MNSLVRMILCQSACNALRALREIWLLITVWTSHYIHMSLFFYHFLHVATVSAVIVLVVMPPNTGVILSWLNTAIFSCLLYIVTEFLYIVILRMTTMQHEMMALFVVYFFRQHYVFFYYVCSMFAGILWQTDGVWNLLLISFVCHWCLDNFVARNNNCVHSILCECSGWTRIFKIGDGKRYAFAFFLVWTANNVIPQ